MSVSQERKSRPWTVTALLAWTLAGVLWDVLSGDESASTWVSGFGLPCAAFIAFGAWRAKRWAFTLMLAAALFIAVIVLPANLFLMNREGSTLFVPSISLVGQLILLFHPATRAYATQGMEVPARSTSLAPGAPSQPLGVRRNTVVALVFLLIAIAVAGILGVIRIYQITG